MREMEDKSDLLVSHLQTCLQQQDSLQQPKLGHASSQQIKIIMSILIAFEGEGLLT